MKTKFTNVYTIFCCLAVLLASVSCETEQLNLNDELLLDSESSLLKKDNAKTPEFEFCNFTANEVKLIAGQFTEVGEVTVEEDGDNYKITYMITVDGYCISETHLSVVSDPSDFPLSGGGNPKNGHFEYSDSHDCVSSVEYLVPKGDGPYIAAHAVVNCVTDTTSENNFGLNLPDEVSFCVTNKAPDTENGYFVINIADGNSLSGELLDAWCVDYESSLKDGECVDVAKVFSTYENIPNDAFVNNGPFDVQGINDEINYIINYDFVGKPYLDTDETFIMGDVQLALWSLIEGNSAEQLYNWMDEPEILGDISLDRVTEIINMAIQNNGYVPGCDGKVAIILIPQDGKQPVIIPRDLFCNTGDCEETAWGAANGEGCEFPGNNWATYFQYGPNGD